MINIYKVSIIIPIYNAEKYLIRCLESVRHQTYSNLEVVLVDDGSTDNCGSICDDYASTNPQFIVIHQQNQGLSGARNSGLKVATGDYLTFLDSDDFLNPYFTETLLNLCLRNNSEVGQCAFQKGCSNTFKRNSKKIIVNKYSNRNALLSKKLKVAAWGKLYAKHLFDITTFPLRRTYEDEFTTYKLIYSSKSISFTNQKLYYYFQSNGSIMRNNERQLSLDFIDAFNERLDFFKSLGETVLYERSKELFCRSLMLTYIKCKRNSDNTNDKEEILNIYKQQYEEFKYYKSVNLVSKIIISLFYVSPNFCSYMVNILRLSNV